MALGWDRSGWKGNERHIGECSHKGWGVHDCRHSEVVAVSCFGDPLAAITATTSRITDQTPSPTFNVNSTISDGSSITDHMPSPTFNVNATPLTGSSIGGSSTTQIIIAVVVVGVLLLIICVIIVIRMEVHIRRYPRQERTEVPMTHVPLTASINDYNNDAFYLDNSPKDGNPLSSIPASDVRHKTYINVQLPPAPVAGAVGGVPDFDDQSEAMYETMLGDKLHTSRAQPTYESLRKGKSNC